MMKNVLK